MVQHTSTVIVSDPNLDSDRHLAIDVIDAGDAALEVVVRDIETDETLLTMPLSQADARDLAATLIARVDSLSE